MDLALDLPMSDKDRYALSLAVKNRTWEEYHAHAKAVDARNAQNFAERQPLVVPQPVLDEANASAEQLELFHTLPKNNYDFVESLIRKLPHRRQRDYFRGLYLREYKAVRNDGSIAFMAGNKQRLHANLFLREVLGRRLDLVLSQYQFDFAWLQLDISDKQKWALQELEKQAKASAIPSHSAPCQKIAGITFGEKRKLTAIEQKAKRPFFLLTEKQIEQLSLQLANCFIAVQTDHFAKLAEQRQDYTEAEIDDVVKAVFVRCGEFCKAAGFTMPYWERFQNSKAPKVKSMESALNRIASEGHWFRLLRKTQRQMIEHLAIASGDVQKKVSAYISIHGFQQHKIQLKKNYDFLKAMILENVEDPNEQIDLLAMYQRSNSSPDIRHFEMMNRIRGVEEWAEENGDHPLFLTLTAPSSYHSQLSRGGQNRKWNGSSPKATQAYLNRVWQQMRALFKKNGIPFYGMRVAEPHHDATPHWHLLAFVRPEHRDKFVEIFRKKALEIDGDERGAKKHRCKVEDCDRKKGSVTGYIAKYISKNINGKSPNDDTSDEVKDLPLKENAQRARAWACLWNIRQFQFYGTGSISVWREVRRLVNQCDDPELEELRICADLGDYAAFVDRLGGCGAPRKEQVAMLHYEDTGTNQYGEQTKRVNGIANRFRAEVAKAVGSVVEFICTRLKKWQIKRKTEKTAIQASQGEAGKSERSSPWTCVSNCNSLNDNEKLELNGKSPQTGAANRIDYSSVRYQRLKLAIEQRQIPLSWLNNNHIFSLLNGGSVRLRGEEVIRFNGYDLEFCIERKF